MALHGSLDDDSPAGALRELAATGQTGAVRFSGNAGCTVYLDRGQLYFARDERTDEALVAALVRPGRLIADDWSAAIAESADQPRVGEVLVGNGAIGTDLLASVVLSVVYDPLIRLFREGDGRFELEADTVHWIGPFRSFDVDAIVAEVRRRVREADEMSPVVPSVDAWVTVMPSLPGDAVQVTLLREDWELLSACRGPHTVAELAHDLGRGQYSTARIVHRLAMAGLVQVDPEASAPAATPDDSASEARTSSAPAVPVGGEPVDPLPAAERDVEPDIQPDPQHAAEPDIEPRSPVVAAADRFDASTFDRRSFDDRPAEPRPSAAWEGELDDEEFERTFERAFGPSGHDAAFDDPSGASAATPAGPGPSDRSDQPDHLPRRQAGPSSVPVSGHDLAPDADPDDSANAVWLESLYSQFMDDSPSDGHERTKEAIDIAFDARDLDRDAKVGTLKRLLGAIRKL